MSPTSARARSSSDRATVARGRLQSSARRDALLDAAVALVRTKGVREVSMEAVAEHAGVSRPLVYKHFANRDELLAAAYRREASKLHGELASEVAVAGNVEEMYRALLRGSIRATVERGQIFTALRAAGGWNRDIRTEQRSRDRDTVRAFAAVAARQYGLDRKRSRSVTAVLLGALDAVLAQWRLDPGERSALLLERTYLAMVVGAYSVEVGDALGVHGHLSVSSPDTSGFRERHQPGAGPAVRFGPLRPGGGTMEVVQEVCERGVVERRVGLEVEGGEVVPGIVWLPEAATGPRPTVILGHGGVVHKRAPEVLGLARRLVRHRGYAAVALDAPEHGERITDKEAARARRRSVQSRVEEGPGAGLPMVVDAKGAAEFASRMTTHVGELTALVDDLVSTGFSDDRVGYWGLSMGTGIGLRFVASEPRIKAAVLGLAGLGIGMGGAEFETAARSLRVPILFLFQWDDELIARDAGLALFDAIGSTDKTMHVNPGGHVQVPVFENDSAESFFVRHLGTGA